MIHPQAKYSTSGFCANQKKTCTSLFICFVLFCFFHQKLRKSDGLSTFNSTNLEWRRFTVVLHTAGPDLSLLLLHSKDWKPHGSVTKWCVCVCGCVSAGAEIWPNTLYFLLTPVRRAGFETHTHLQTNTNHSLILNSLCLMYWLVVNWHWSRKVPCGTSKRTRMSLSGCLRPDSCTTVWLCGRGLAEGMGEKGRFDRLKPLTSFWHLFPATYKVCLKFEGTVARAAPVSHAALVQTLPFRPPCWPALISPWVTAGWCAVAPPPPASAAAPPLPAPGLRSPWRCAAARRSCRCLAASWRGWSRGWRVGGACAGGSWNENWRREVEERFVKGQRLKCQLYNWR